MASNAMLAVPAKRSGYLDIKSPVENYIASQFSSGAAQQAASALQQAQLLRNQAAELKGGADDIREAFQGYGILSATCVPDVSHPYEVLPHAAHRHMPRLILVLEARALGQGAPRQHSPGCFHSSVSPSSFSE